MFEFLKYYLSQIFTFFTTYNVQITREMIPCDYYEYDDDSD